MQKVAAEEDDVPTAQIVQLLLPELAEYVPALQFEQMIENSD
jgi:hypothetical protein